MISKVLDEADRLVTNEGLSQTIREILTHLPERRQTLLFSATMSITEEQTKFLNLKNVEKHFQGQTYHLILSEANI